MEISARLAVTFPVVNVSGAGGLNLSYVAVVAQLRVATHMHPLSYPSHLVSILSSRAIVASVLASLLGSRMGSRLEVICGRLEVAPE